MRKSLLLVVFAVLVAVPLAAQNTDIEALSGLTFNFGNPGARSLGMGGAFLGLADDASAAEANPAGLTILRKMEISIEGRSWQNVQTFNTSGTFPDLESDDFNSYNRERVPVTFASAVLPVGANFSLAAYYHDALEQNTEVLNIFGETSPSGEFFLEPINFFLGPQGPVNAQQCADLGTDCTEYQLFPFFTAVDTKMKTWGVAGAWKTGSFSWGLGVRYHQFEEFAATVRTDFDLFISNAVSQRSDDTDTTFTAGMKWTINPQFSIGAVYKQGPSFDSDLEFQDLQNAGPVVNIGSVPFEVPDTYGVGISYRPIPTLTLNADAVQVNYSALTDNFATVLDLTPAEVEGFESDDVTEFHVGGELFFPTRVPFAIRGGWWRDPAHSIVYRGSLLSPATVAAQILYPEREDQDHWTIGVGLAWPQFQIDAAYDTSDVYKVGSLSAVFRF
jgi:long-subunit fatty acid transport protein